MNDGVVRKNWATKKGAKHAVRPAGKSHKGAVSPAEYRKQHLGVKKHTS